MKRTFLAAILGVAALLGLARPTFAWCWPFNCCCSPCKQCGADFCIRQYNAFTPVCHGTIYCDGIHPFAGPGYPGAVSPWIDANSAGCPSCAAGAMMGGPMMGGPMMAGPAMGAYGMAMPGYGAPGYGAPGYGAPGYGAPGYGAPMYGAPAYGAPLVLPPGQVPPGQPPAGQPGFPPQPNVLPPANPQGNPPRPLPSNPTMTSADGSDAWMIPAASLLPVSYYPYPYMPMMPWQGQ